MNKIKSFYSVSWLIIRPYYIDHAQLNKKKRKTKSFNYLGNLVYRASQPKRTHFKICEICTSFEKIVKQINFNLSKNQILSWFQNYYYIFLALRGTLLKNLKSKWNLVTHKSNSHSKCDSFYASALRLAKNRLKFKKDT